MEYILTIFLILPYSDIPNVDTSHIRVSSEQECVSTGRALREQALKAVKGDARYYCNPVQALK